MSRQGEVVPVSHEQLCFAPSADIPDHNLESDVKARSLVKYRICRPCQSSLSVSYITAIVHL